MFECSILNRCLVFKWSFNSLHFRLMFIYNILENFSKLKCCWCWKDTCLSQCDSNLGLLRMPQDWTIEYMSLKPLGHHGRIKFNNILDLHCSRTTYFNYTSISLAKYKSCNLFLLNFTKICVFYMCQPQEVSSHHG